MNSRREVANLGNARLDEAQTGIKMAGRNTHNFRYADDTTLMAESKEDILKGGAQEHPGQAQETALEGPQQVILSLHENPVPVLAWVPGS